MTEVLVNPKPSELKSTTTEAEGSVEEEEEEIFFQDIYLLAEHNVPIEDIEALKEKGINTIRGLQMAMKPKLLKISGFTEEKVHKLKDICSKVSTDGGFVTALEVSEQRRQIFRICTGSDNLDKLLGGGIESMSVTEVFGEARTGKTQIAHTLCVTAQIPNEDGYPGGKVMYIDTEHSFRPERIRSIADRFELEQKSVLENILYARAYNSEHQYELLKIVANKFHEDAGVFKLLIIDSIMATFRVDFSGRELINRQKKLGLMMSKLQKISEEYNVAVFITNQITTEFNNKMNVIEIDLPKPTGGNVMAHASTTRIALKKVMGNRRIAVLFDSPSLEEDDIVFTITGGGIRDPKDASK